MSSTTENVDRISSLPDDVLTHILSLMPTKSVVRTCIIAKRWRYSWTTVTKLVFDDNHPFDSLDSLTKFVDRVLELHKASQVKLFSLHFYEIWARKFSVSKWIDEAVKLKVSELDVDVIRLGLPLSLFTCKTLTKLVLACSDFDVDQWKCPSSVNLPCLKKLIAVSSNPSDNALKLVKGCPVLESLFLQVDCYEDEEELNFDIPTLKRLKLITLKCRLAMNTVLLNLPNLEYLYVGEILCSRFVIKDLSSLVEVKVSYFKVKFDHLWVNLLKGISGAKSLSWSGLSENVSPTSPLPIFLKLKHLEMDTCFRCGWLLISKILENSSELEDLCIEALEESSWIEPSSVPACMLTNLSTIKFTKFKGRKCDIQFLEYMLGNAEVLKTVTITCEKYCQEEKRLCAQLFKLPKASRLCEIRFVGNQFQSTSN